MFLAVRESRNARRWLSNENEERKRRGSRIYEGQSDSEGRAGDLAIYHPTTLGVRREESHLSLMHNSVSLLLFFAPLSDSNELELGVTLRRGGSSPSSGRSRTRPTAQAAAL